MFNHSQNYGLIICPLSPSHSQSLTPSLIHPLHTYLRISPEYVSTINPIQFNPQLGGCCSTKQNTHTIRRTTHTERSRDFFVPIFERRLLEPEQRGTPNGSFYFHTSHPLSSSNGGHNNNVPWAVWQEEPIQRNIEQKPTTTAAQLSAPHIARDRPTDPCRLNLRVLSFLLRTPLAGCSKVQYR